MYKFNIVNCSQRLTERELAEVESKIAVVFPPALKEHYMKFNGGKIDGDRCRFIKPLSDSKDINDFSLKDFYPIKYKIRSRQQLFEDVYEMLVVDQKVVPGSYIPIADDVSGWPICCKIEDGSLSLLYREQLDENGKEILVHIADSLEEFIDGMLTREEYENIA